MDRGLRPELLAISHFGTMLDEPVRTKELRDGRLVPLPVESQAELDSLKRVSREIASRAVFLTHTLVPTELLRIPAPKQLDRITFNIETGCWELPTYQDKQGRARYGIFHLKGIPNPSGLAHRTMYQIFFGTDSLPNGRADFLDHLCENKTCCYPRHLERVTPGENTMRGRAGLRLDQVMLDLPDDEN